MERIDLKAAKKLAKSLHIRRFIIFYSAEKKKPWHLNIVTEDRPSGLGPSGIGVSLFTSAGEVKRYKSLDILMTELFSITAEMPKGTISLPIVISY